MKVQGSRLVRAIFEPTNGGHAPQRRTPNRVKCADGFEMSVISGGGTYCYPRPDLCLADAGVGCENKDVYQGFVECSYTGPFTKLEVGFMSARPEPWELWAPYSETGSWEDAIFPFVPIEMLFELVLLHGGEIDYS